MSIRYLIDGHNLIWGNKYFTGIAQKDLQSSHQILINAVCSYLKNKKNVYATIFFDNRFSTEMEKELWEKTEVIYCPKIEKGKGADDYLTKRIEKTVENEKFVITNDKELQYRCRIRGGKIFSSEKFLELIGIK